LKGSRVDRKRMGFLNVFYSEDLRSAALAILLHKMLEY